MHFLLAKALIGPFIVFKSEGESPLRSGPLKSWLPISTFLSFVLPSTDVRSAKKGKRQNILSASIGFLPAEMRYWFNRAGKVSLGGTKPEPEAFNGVGGMWLEASGMLGKRNLWFSSSIENSFPLLVRTSFGLERKNCEAGF